MSVGRMRQSTHSLPVGCSRAVSRYCCHHTKGTHWSHPRLAIHDRCQATKCSPNQYIKTTSFHQVSSTAIERHEGVHATRSKNDWLEAVPMTGPLDKCCYDVKLHVSGYIWGLHPKFSESSLEVWQRRENSVRVGWWCIDQRTKRVGSGWFGGIFHSRQSSIIGSTFDRVWIMQEIVQPLSVHDLGTF